MNGIIVCDSDMWTTGHSKALPNVQRVVRVKALSGHNLAKKDILEAT